MLKLKAEDIRRALTRGPKYSLRAKSGDSMTAQPESWGPLIAKGSPVSLAASLSPVSSIESSASGPWSMGHRNLVSSQGSDGNPDQGDDELAAILKEVKCDLIDFDEIEAPPTLTAASSASSRNVGDVPPPASRPAGMYELLSRLDAEVKKTCAPLDSRTKYKGVKVRRVVGGEKWSAQIRMSKVKGLRPLGTFGDALTAARAYDAAVVKYKLGYQLNFPNEHPDYKSAKQVFTEASSVVRKKKPSNRLP